VAGPDDPLSAERVAALVAPVIDRLRNTMVRAIKGRGDELVSQFGAGGPALQTLGMLRNALPIRAVTREELGAVLRYLPPAEVDAGVAEAVAAGLLDDEAELRATARGRACLDRLYALGADVVGDLWSGHEARVESLLGLTARLLDAASQTGGPAFAVMFPPWEPAGATPAMRLAERLTPLRFHRFDAHIQAWEAEGLTVEEVQALGAGPVRDRIENKTNRLAGAPYAALHPAERVELLGGLGALPN
jgi:hypothetical protein